MQEQSIQKSNGFTLLELLVAIFIFSLIGGAVYGAYSKTFSNIKSVESTVEAAIKARAVFRLLTDDLQGLIPGEGSVLIAEERVSENMDGEIIRFLSSSNIVFTRDQISAGRTLIRYFLQKDEENTAFDLIRSDSPVVPGQKESDEQTGEIVVDGIKNLTMTFVTRGGGEKSSWQKAAEDAEEVEDGLRLLPALVKISITFFSSEIDEERTFSYRTAVWLPVNS